MRHSRGGAMVDVASRGGARGRPRDAPVALELDERPLVPVHLQQHRVPDSHRGRGLHARERRWRWRARKSAQFRHVRRRIGGGIGPRARAGGGGGVGVPRVARGGAARSARSRHCRRRAADERLSHSVALAPSASAAEVSRRDQTRLVLPRFSKAASAAGPVPRCPRLITPGRAPRGATPSTSSATRARAGSRREATGANEETRPSRVKGRRRRRLRRLGRLGRWWNLRDRRRRRPPRRAPSTGPHAAKGTARSRARSSWRWSARLERSGKRTRGM